MGGLSGMGTTAFDLRNRPAYGLAEAGHYIRLPVATLRSWVAGRAYPRADSIATFQPLIRAAKRNPTLLSFYNLIEAHVLRSLRTEHGVALNELRTAIRFAQSTLRIDRLLLSKDLCTHAGQVFLDKYGSLINLSASGQIAMRRMLEEHLARVDWDDAKFPIRLYPYVRSQGGDQRRIAIDPTIAFGRPVVLRVGVSTTAIAQRIDSGESVDALAEDYDLRPAEIEEAVLCERAA
jgi:uncharacterized protein (DUF433 family)